MQNVSVAYSLVHAELSLRKTIISLLKSGKKIDKDNATKNKLAVNNVSFTLSHGDRLALIGGNGAGKTTLLKALSGLYEPLTGSIVMDGSKSSFIELGAGMDYGLSGEKNAELHYFMRGFDKGGLDLDSFIHNVETFADLGESFYYPVKTYSSGMFVRLAFAMVTEVYPEILLLDEWLSAGDMFFMEKANKRMEVLAESIKIMVLATHSTDLTLKWCNKALVLNSGTGIFFDDVESAIEYYESGEP